MAPQHASNELVRSKPDPQNYGIRLRSDMVAELIDSMGGDASIARAAKVSTGRDVDLEDRPVEGLINYLLKERHGVPFESVLFTFRVECPIFVARQLVKHRVASMNEISGRYVELKPEFWVPREDRPLSNVGSSARPDLRSHTRQFSVHEIFQANLLDSYHTAWDVYQWALYDGIANEVARTVLPVATYTSLYFTVNLRSLFNVLALRVKDDSATVVSRPQSEIQEVAIQMEQYVAQVSPFAYAAFLKAGRVAP